MADILASKAATEVVTRRWTVPGDDPATAVTTSASGVTVDESSLEDGDVVLTLSGGTAAATGSIVLTITTSAGQTLIETLYIPVVQSAAQIADTAAEYIAFALRKIVGFGESAEADEQTAALDHLNALVAEMRAVGADIGAPFPMTTASVIYCPDYAVNALRHNLLVRCWQDYGQEPSALQYDQARRGMQLVKQANLTVPAVAYY